MPLPIMAKDLADALRGPLRQAEIDRDAFERPLAECQLHRCKATCCHDGVILDPLEVTLLEETAAQHKRQLTAFGIDDSHPLFHTDGSRVRRTVTAPAAASDLAEDFPEHFPRTRCVFLDDQHRCAWQRLADHQGLHPWAYKPVSCWMHPVALRPAPDCHSPPILTVAGQTDDPLDFAACTPCGRPTASGKPARETLWRELTVLSAIAGRQFLAELGVESANIAP